MSPKSQVIGWLLDGMRGDEVAAAIAEQFPWLRRDDVLDEVVAHFVTIAEADKLPYLGWALESFRDIYRRALAAGELDIALRATKELATLAQRMPGVRSPAPTDTASESGPPQRKGKSRKRLDGKESG